LTYIVAADSMGLCLLVFTQLSLESEPSESKTSGTKTEFGVKLPLKFILGHLFCNPLQAEKGWNIAI